MSGQYLELQGLRGKILRNKELDEGSEGTLTSAALRFLMEHLRMVPFCTVAILSKGCSSHWARLGLWKKGGAWQTSRCYSVDRVLSLISSTDRGPARAEIGTAWFFSAGLLHSPSPNQESIQAGTGLSRFVAAKAIARFNCRRYRHTRTKAANSIKSGVLGDWGHCVGAQVGE